MKHDETLQTWLSQFELVDSIYIASSHRQYAHAEKEYDAQYGIDNSNSIEKTIGSFIIDAAGFVPQTCLEIACGTGHLTASLLYDGRIEKLVATDASGSFLELTRRKVNALGGDTQLFLMQLADTEFDQIPVGVFDAIMMRSALHHFLDFKSTAVALASKLRRGGGMFLLEPRADFHIASSLILNLAKAKAQQSKGSWAKERWTRLHDQSVTMFTDTASFYLSRTRDKAGAEDKYVFHLDELLEIAELSRTRLSRIGGEYISKFSAHLREYLLYCMSFNQVVVDDIMYLAEAEIAFLDQTYETDPRYSPAEWFLFRAT